MSNEQTYTDAEMRAKVIEAMRPYFATLAPTEDPETMTDERLVHHVREMKAFCESFDRAVEKAPQECSVVAAAAQPKEV